MRDVLVALADTFLFLGRHWSDVLRVGFYPFVVTLALAITAVNEGDASGWSDVSLLANILMTAWFSTAIHRMILVPPTMEQARFIRSIGSKEIRFSFYYVLLALPVGTAFKFLDIVSDAALDPRTAWITAIGIAALLYLIIRSSLILPAAALGLEGGVVAHFRLSWLRMRGFVLKSVVVGAILVLFLAGIGSLFGLLWNLWMVHVFHVPPDHEIVRLMRYTTFTFFGWGLLVIGLSHLFRYRAQDQVDLHLAAVHRKGNNFGAARHYYERVLRFREDTLGSGHPAVADSLKDLAMTNLAEEEYPEAEVQFQHLLGIQESTLSPGHSGLAETLNHLATVCEAQGKYAQARAYCERVLEIREDVFGADHPLSAVAQGNLGKVLHQLGKYDEAEPLFRQQTAVLQSLLGPKHPDLIEPLENYAALMRDRGKIDEAKALEDRINAIEA